jgi:hypothetical protein
MPDTGAAGIFTGGKLQAKALQWLFPRFTIDTSTAGRHNVSFGNNSEMSFIRTMNMATSFETICFTIISVEHRPDRAE